MSINIPHTFTSGTLIESAKVNENFQALANAALNKAGDTITGNIAVDTGITVDGADISEIADGGGGDLTGTTLTLSGSSATSIDTNGGMRAGSGNVGIIDSSGRIPAISSTYFASLAGTDITGIALLGTAQTWSAIQTTSAQPRVRAFNAGAQTISNNTETAVTFDSESYDVGACHSTASATSRIVVPAGAGGLWVFTGTVSWAAANTSIRRASIKKNGSAFIAKQSCALNSSLAVANTVTAQDVAIAGDYYELFAFQLSGSTLDTVAGNAETHFSGSMVS